MTHHGPLCACTPCWTVAGLDPFDDDRDGKAIARAEEHDYVDDCD